MSLASGARLGPYEIAGLLGSGGMGEVYRASDPRLGRDVAIKVLPTGFSADPDRLRRFEQEARAAAALNHPGILAVHDVGTENGAPYIVSELLEGETLRDRLNKGSAGTGQTSIEAGGLAVRKAVDYAIQMARGLAAAHEKGITHRDLKPENLFITTDGRVKILDFGLAKLTEADAAHPGGGSLPTVAPVTEPGMLLGTMGYMAPEQVRGQTADHRSDIFAFGAILYEMLSGQRAFRGATAADTISAILDKDPPDLPMAERHIPPALERVVDRCLEKSPAARFQSTQDLAFALEGLSGYSESSAADGALPAPKATRREQCAIAVAAAAVMASLVLGWFAWRTGSQSDVATRQPMRLALELPPTQALSRTDAEGSNPTQSLVLSPHGNRLVYVADRDGTPQLVVRDMNGGTTTPLGGTEGASEPFFSPDGEWVGFFANGKLKKVALGGGAPVALCDVQMARGASWGSDDGIIFSPALYSGLLRVPAAGGRPQPVTAIDAKSGERSHRWPDVLPGGTAVLFAVGLGTAFDDARIVVQSLETGRRTTLIEGGTNPRYVPTGHLVYARTGILTAVPFDARRLAITGPPVKVLDGVLTEGSGAAQFTFSTSGTLVSVPGSATRSESAVVWVDRGGRITRVPLPPGAFGAPGQGLAVARDGQHIAAVTLGSELSVFDLVRGTKSIVMSGARTHSVTWMPDGKRFVFSSEKKGGWDLFWKRADGSGDEEALLPPGDLRQSVAVSRDGRLVAYDEVGSTGRGVLWILSLEDRKAHPLPGGRESEGWPAFSPDDRYLAYTVGELNQSQVFVRALPAGDERWQVSTQGGTAPHWSPDGRELFFRNRDQMLSVAVEPGPPFTVGPPRVLFEARFLPGYDVAPDGRFLMLQPTSDDKPPLRFDVTTDWFAELAQKVKGKR